MYVFNLGGKQLRARITIEGDAVKCEFRHYKYDGIKIEWKATDRGTSLDLDEMNKLREIVSGLYDHMEAIPNSLKKREPFHGRIEYLCRRGNRAKISMYKRVVQFHIRHYGCDEVTKQFYPTRMGVVMCLRELGILVRTIPRMCQLMSSLERQQKETETKQNAKRIRLSDDQ